MPTLCHPLKATSRRSYATRTPSMSPPSAMTYTTLRGTTLLSSTPAPSPSLTTPTWSPVVPPLLASFALTTLSLIKLMLKSSIAHLGSLHGGPGASVPPVTLAKCQSLVLVPPVSSVLDLLPDGWRPSCTTCCSLMAPPGTSLVHHYDQIPVKYSFFFLSLLSPCSFFIMVFLCLLGFSRFIFFLGSNRVFFLGSSLVLPLKVLLPLLPYFFCGQQASARGETGSRETAQRQPPQGFSQMWLS